MTDREFLAVVIAITAFLLIASIRSGFIPRAFGDIRRAEDPLTFWGAIASGISLLVGLGYLFLKP